MVEDAGRPGDAPGRSDQPAARVLGAVEAAAGELHHDRGQRLGRQLVWARHQDAARHDGLAVRQPGLARRRDALCDGGEDGVPGAGGDRVHRRRRDADERAQRHDHHLQVLAGVVEPEANRDGAEQPGPEPGDVGGAGAIGCRQDGVDPGDPRHGLPLLCRAAGLEGHRVPRPRAGRRRLGRGAGGGPAGGPQHLHRPQRPAVAAAHHADGREELHHHAGTEPESAAC